MWSFSTICSAFFRTSHVKTFQWKVVGMMLLWVESKQSPQPRVTGRWLLMEITSRRRYPSGEKCKCICWVDWAWWHSVDPIWDHKCRFCKKRMGDDIWWSLWKLCLLMTKAQIPFTLLLLWGGYSKETPKTNSASFWKSFSKRWKIDFLRRHRELVLNDVHDMAATFVIR